MSAKDAILKAIKIAKDKKIIVTEHCYDDSTFVWSTGYKEDAELLLDWMEEVDLNSKLKEFANYEDRIVIAF